MLEMKRLNELRDEYNKEGQNIIKHRILNKVPIIELLTDGETEIEFDFNINIKTHGVTNQQNTGRCWAFAALNILRERVIEKCALDNFEFSGSYVAFYDKLERFNNILEKIVKLKKDNRNCYDRELSYVLELGMTDGGSYTAFVDLVKKYGLVPKSAFPESFSSDNTYEVNQILSRLIRKFYVDLSKSKVNQKKLINSYLEKAYSVVASIYGVPPLNFNFQYTDKNGEYHIDKDITPMDFYKKYVGEDLLDEYIEVSSYQDEKYKYNSIYEVEDTKKMVDGNNSVVLNLPFSDFKKLIVKQIKDKELVYFYSSTTSRRIDGIWIDLMQRYGDLFNIDLSMNRNDIIEANGITNYHSMLITGVNFIDGKPEKWKIQNSWGAKFGRNGYYVATDDWINKYVHKVVINKKYLTSKQLEILNNETIKIDKWSVKF